MTIIQVATFTPYGTDIIVALVESTFTVAGEGDLMLRRISRHYPFNGIMLVSIQQNGFRAYAAFQTAQLLALLQLEVIDFTALDLNGEIADERPLPF